ncbi:hypothetical protein MBSD_n2152 [Mizugakiibacter sediminis]|uniref:Phage tail assembly chaperone-like domain-containing protein n=1 Tax=Mizugakiibacter sediminis TaxID=1475481 RepID=A0A0K8QR29_9GAMM|nr:tail fiber assembly protein [Mizugakiibacter sediminis]GAP66837.1 hypothetical protein MBSD_n2152 [Mizugakiibacter sediminis]
MYAITATGYRCIANATDVLPGETAVDELPASLLTALAASEARQQRDGMLAASDWTQVADAPLTATQKTAWATYRQALRDVPAQAGFPDAIDWPAMP